MTPILRPVAAEGQDGICPSGTMGCRSEEREDASVGIQNGVVRRVWEARRTTNFWR